MFDNDSKNVRDAKKWLGIILVGVLFFILFIYVYRLAYYFLNEEHHYMLWEANPATAGQYGDLIGGVVGTAVALLSVILLFITLNNQQKNYRKERFENRFFELISSYRAIVDEMNIADKVYGRKCFLRMYKEFESLYEVCENIYTTNKLTIFDKCPLEEIDTYKSIYGEDFQKQYTNSKICEVAYQIFFSGIGLSSEKYLAGGSEIDSNYFDLIKQELKSIQEKYTAFLLDDTNKVLEQNAGYTKKEKVFGIGVSNTGNVLPLYNVSPQTLPYRHYEFHPYQIKTKHTTVLVNYFPFDGHISRLGHYYRHLFQIVRYVVQQEQYLLSKSEVLEFLKILRTQMSNHEQILLYYNSVAGVGDRWIRDDRNGNKNYLLEYRMIHNIPFPLAKFGINIEERFKNQMESNDDIFEWQWSN